MNNVIDPGPIILTQIIQLTFKLKLLKLKKIVGKADKEELARVEKSLKELKQWRRNFPPGTMF